MRLLLDGDAYLRIEFDFSNFLKTEIWQKVTGNQIKNNKWLLIIHSYYLKAHLHQTESNQIEFTYLFI